MGEVRNSPGSDIFPQEGITATQTDDLLGWRKQNCRDL
jgi:hypothetical protein